MVRGGFRSPGHQQRAVYGSRVEKAKSMARKRAAREAAEAEDALKGGPTGLPSSPCFRCGARGWCGHPGRVAETVIAQVAAEPATETAAWSS